MADHTIHEHKLPIPGIINLATRPSLKKKSARYVGYLVSYLNSTKEAQKMSPGESSEEERSNQGLVNLNPSFLLLTNNRPEAPIIPGPVIFKVPTLVVDPTPSLR